MFMIQWSSHLERIYYLINSFIHSGHFYSASSSLLLLIGAPDYSTDTVSEFHAEAHRQLWVKDLPKVPAWRLERESNPRPSGWESSTNATPRPVAQPMTIVWLHCSRPRPSTCHSHNHGIAVHLHCLVCKITWLFINISNENWFRERLFKVTKAAVFIVEG